MSLRSATTAASSALARGVLLPSRRQALACASSSASPSSASSSFAWSSSARPSSCRALHTSPRALAAHKPSMAGISAIRKSAPGTSMLKAKEALIATYDAAAGREDVSAALNWLEADRQQTGAKKAEKVAGRDAHEGVVGVCVLTDGLGTASASGGPTPPPRAGLVELNCETDFVARNDVFSGLVQDLAHTAAVFADVVGPSALTSTATATPTAPALVDLPLSQFLAFPLCRANPQASSAAADAASPAFLTVNDAIIDAVSRLGEKIGLARASTVRTPGVPPADAPRRSESNEHTATYVVSAFGHGAALPPAPSSSSPASHATFAVGKVVSLLLTRFSGSAFASASASASASDDGDGDGDALRKKTRALCRSLARQAAGMETTSIRAHAPATTTTAADADADAAAPAPAPAPAPASVSTSLYAQPFMMLLPSAGLVPRESAGSAEGGEETVEGVLVRWARETLRGGEARVDVVGMRRWTLGEGEGEQQQQQQQHEEA